MAKLCIAFTLGLLLCGPPRTYAQDVAKEQDLQTILAWKHAVARHVNPQPDSALWYIHRIRAFSQEIQHAVGLFEADHLQAHYFRRVQQLDSSILYFKKSLRIAEAIPYPKGLAVTYNGLCRTYPVLGAMDSARQACLACLEVLKDLPEEVILPDTYTALGNVYLKQHRLKEAIQFFLKVDSLHSLKPVREDVVAAAFQSLGTIYLRLEELEVAASYFLKAHEQFNQMPGKPVFYLRTTDRHLGEVYFRQGKWEQADSLLQLSLDFFTQIQDQLTVAEISRYLGMIQREQQNWAEAEAFLKTAWEIHSQEGISSEASIAALELGKLYVLRQQADLAVGYLEKALNNPAENAEARQAAFFALAEAETQRGRHRIANDWLRQGMQLKDSLATLQNAAAIRELEAVYQTEKQEQEIALLKTENELSDQQSRNQRNLFLGGILILGLALIGVMILYQNKQKTTRKLQELDRMKSDFFANISHEFRTPLTLISGPIEARLAQENLQPEDRRDFEMVARNNQRLLGLVNQVMDLSRLESGHLRLVVEPWPAREVIGSLIDAFAYAAQQKKQTYLVEIQAEGVHWFDRDALEKMLTNLLSNAIKYTPEGGEIRVGAEIHDARLSFTVRNTGPGLSIEAQEKVFDRFFQGDEHQEGVGIGLALTRELVELHQGNISVESQPGAWTQFVAEIPVGQASYPEAVSQPPRSVEAHLPLVEAMATPAVDSVPSGDAEQPLLLIVEDNPDVQHLLKHSLASSYQILLASQGQQGLELAREHTPDLILSDIMMPVMDGLTFTQEIRQDERTSHIPLILLTAKAGEEPEWEGIEKGADDFLTKPFSQKILEAKVRQLIEMRKKLQARYSQTGLFNPKEIALNSVDEEVLMRVQKVLGEKLTDPDLTAQSFSEAVGMSRMNLHRKLKALTGLSTTAFIRTERLKAAAALLGEKRLPVAEVGYAVGFNDPSYFSRSFRELYACSPSEFREKA
ncbi:MAG: ATP-binding protein [Bacteroidota bacterium]